MSAAAPRVVVDPITRIEGHLRIEAEMDAANRIVNAYSSGTMVRGIETILKGRDPRDAWAFAQRICGVCTWCTASPRCARWRTPSSIERAGQRQAHPQPDDRRPVRARPRHALLPPARAGLGGRGSAPERRPHGDLRPGPVHLELAQVLARLLRRRAEAAQGLRRVRPARHLRQRLLGPPGLQAAARGQPDGRGPLPGGPGLAARRRPAARHLRRQEPAPQLRRRRRAVPDRPQLRLRHQRQEAGRRCRTSSQPCASSSTRSMSRTPWPSPASTRTGRSRGEGLGNFLCYGDFPAHGHRRTPSDCSCPARRHPRPRPHQHPRGRPARRQRRSRSSSRHSWYDYAGGKDTGLHPYAGETKLNYTGPASHPTRTSTSRTATPGSSRRAGRARPVEVGPLARVLMLYATGHEQTKELVDDDAREARPARDGAVLHPGPHRRPHPGDQDRRRCHAGLVRRPDRQHQGRRHPHLQRRRSGSPPPGRAARKGAGFMEAPRGALGHWIVIEDGRIANYQAVVPTTWNAGPRDPQGQPGRLRGRPRGHVLHDPSQPIEILRTIHSFDPCIACAVHVSGPGATPRGLTIRTRGMQT